jgi:hypothetical protein
MFHLLIFVSMGKGLGSEHTPNSLVHLNAVKISNVYGRACHPDLDGSHAMVDLGRVPVTTLLGGKV